MVPTIVERTAIMLRQWSKFVLSGEAEFEMAKEFLKLTADVITHTAFGRGYAEGKNFNMQDQQLTLAAESFSRVYIPGFR